MKKVVGFGDFLLRLSPPGYQRFLQAQSYDINYTGAEANVLVSLALMGVDTRFVTRVPDNDIARTGLLSLQKYGVDISSVVKGGDRLGLFYAEKGASQRPSRIVYDRKYTSIAQAQISDFDWPKLLEDAQWLHITGITPALGAGLPAICEQAFAEAHARGITVSMDLNYRKNLWTSEEARAVIERLLPYVDVVIANEEDADKVLGIAAPDSDVVAGVLSRAGYESVARQICERYGVGKVAITLRRSISASDNEWSAMLFDGAAHFSKTYTVHLVDRVGGGDSFGAGLIYALINGYSSADAIEYAAAASCLKQTIEMDFNLSSPAEILQLMGGDGSGRVQR